MVGAGLSKRSESLLNISSGGSVHWCRLESMGPLRERKLLSLGMASLEKVTELQHLSIQNTKVQKYVSKGMNAIALMKNTLIPSSGIRMTQHL